MRRSNRPSSAVLFVTLCLAAGLLTSVLAATSGSGVYLPIMLKGLRPTVEPTAAAQTTVACATASASVQQTAQAQATAQAILQQSATAQAVQTAVAFQQTATAFAVLQTSIAQTSIAQTATSSPGGLALASLRVNTVPGCPTPTTDPIAATQTAIACATSVVVGGTATAHAQATSAAATALVTTQTASALTATAQQTSVVATQTAGARQTQTAIALTPDNQSLHSVQLNNIDGCPTATISPATATALAQTSIAATQTAVGFATVAAQQTAAALQTSIAASATAIAGATQTAIALTPTQGGLNRRPASAATTTPAGTPLPH